VLVLTKSRCDQLGDPEFIDFLDLVEQPHKGIKMHFVTTEVKLLVVHQSIYESKQFGTQAKEMDVETSAELDTCPDESSTVGCNQWHRHGSIKFMND
jgi:hypothetical protein